MWWSRADVAEGPGGRARPVASKRALLEGSTLSERRPPRSTWKTTSSDRGGLKPMSSTCFC
jgi:hypothetical protein